MANACPSENTVEVDASSFWSNGNVNWDAHRIGWIVAGSFAAATVVISFTHVFQHLRNYTVPKEQRQIVRIILLPPVYAVVAFFSYRFFRSATYYQVAVTAYEALAIGAFFLLLVYYVGDSPDKQREVFLRKDKRKIPFPFCCWRLRPGKPMWLALLKWSVLQYCLMRPAISIASIICQAYNVLCEGVYSVHFAAVYLEAIDFVSISIALEGLIILYTLLKEDLHGRRPLAKFMSIKIVIFVTFYQGFVFSALAKHGTIKATDFWTASNVADGLQALATSIECVLFAFYNFWAFNVAEYKALAAPGARHTNVFKSFLHSQNYWDFIKEFARALAFGWAFVRHKPGTRLEPSGFSLKAAMDGEKPGPLAMETHDESHELQARRRDDMEATGGGSHAGRSTRWQTTAPSELLRHHQGYVSVADDGHDVRYPTPPPIAAMQEVESPRRDYPDERTTARPTSSYSMGGRGVGQAM